MTHGAADAYEYSTGETAAQLERYNDEQWAARKLAKQYRRDFAYVEEAIAERCDVIACILLDESLTRAEIAEEIEAVIVSYCRSCAGVEGDE